MDLTALSTYHRKRWIFVLVSGIIMALLVVGWIAGRYYVTSQHNAQVTNNQQTLCQVIRNIVITGDRDLAAITYYKHHPADLARAHAQNMGTLRKLDCQKIG
jgi:hypothetical protein